MDVKLVLIVVTLSLHGNMPFVEIIQCVCISENYAQAVNDPPGFDGQLHTRKSPGLIIHFHENPLTGCNYDQETCQGCWESRRIRRRENPFLALKEYETFKISFLPANTGKS